jgi:hypothetical protein
MLRDEEESLRFFLQEERFNDMSIQNINQLQGEASHAYDHVPSSEGAAWAMVIAQCEIAQQLARIATQLEDGQIASLEGGNVVERLSRIAIGIESLNTGR